MRCCDIEIYLSLRKATCARRNTEFLVTFFQRASRPIVEKAQFDRVFQDTRIVRTVNITYLSPSVDRSNSRSFGDRRLISENNFAMADDIDDSASRASELLINS